MQKFTCLPSTLLDPRVDPGVHQGQPWLTPGLTLGSSRVDPAWPQGCWNCLTPRSTLVSTRVNPAWPQGQPWGQPGLTLVYPKVDPGDKQGRPWFTPGLTLGSSRVDPGWHQGWPWMILDSFFGGSPDNPNLTSIQLKSTLTRKPSMQCFGGYPVNYIHVTWLVTITCKLIIIISHLLPNSSHSFKFGGN